MTDCCAPLAPEGADPGQLPRDRVLDPRPHATGVTSCDLLANYFTLGDLAEAFGRTERTILRWIDQPNGLPHLRLGGRLLFKKSSVENWLAKKETQRNPRRGRRVG